MSKITMEKQIRIRCKAAENISLDKFKELQGNLKELKQEGYDKIKNSIIERGFIYPMFAWLDKKTYWIEDGHQRKRILDELVKEGYEVPDLPTVFVEAKDRKEAKEILLIYNSHYAKITDDGLYEFLNEPDYEIDLESIECDLDLPDIDLEGFKLGYGFEVSDSFTGEVEEMESVNPRMAKCPECGHSFDVKINMDKGKQDYHEQIQES